MLVLNPYLNFPGTTEEAFNFYKSVFGGEFQTLQRFKDTPEKDRLTPELQEKIMHIALPISGNTLMGTDAIESMGHPLTMGNNISLSINLDDRAEADRIHAALSAGGTVTVPMQDMFWGDYFGMCTDTFGVQWMVNCAKAK